MHLFRRPARGRGVCRKERRAAGPESLDGAGGLPPAQLAQNLDDLANIKRWLGFDAAVWRWLVAASRRSGRGLTVLDAATGGADVPLQMARRACRAGLDLWAIAIDLHPQVAGEARRRTRDQGRVAVARADALHLPLPDASVDLALCSYTLHHFGRPEATRLLAELQRVSRVGLVVADLTRSRPAYGVAWLLLRLWGPRHRLSQRDGPLSIRRAYTPCEMGQLAAEAGLPRPLVVRRIPFEAAILAPAEVFTGRGG
jgi:SAM-dependent methyltransferase